MNHSDIMNLWPSIAEFADDIGVAYGTAKAMRLRKSIPVGYFESVVSSASSRGFIEVTYESLSLAASVERVA